MEDTPAAAAPATEANPNINSNEAPATPAESTPNVPQAAIPADQIENFNKFINANGGYEKAFDKLKQAVSNPTPAPQSTTQPAPSPTITPTDSVANNGMPSNAQPINPFDTPEGYLNANKIALLNYNEMLQKAYPELDKDYMIKGEFMKEAQSLGMTVMDNQGNINDRVIRKFLDLKKDAVQPAAPSEPVTATPTVTYVNPEGELDSRAKAQQIMAQGEGHPQYQAAVNFMRRSLYPNKKAPQTPQSK